MANVFQGKEGQVMPHMPDDFVDTVSARYQELYERMTGRTFQPADQEHLYEDIKESVMHYLSERQ